MEFIKNKIMPLIDILLAPFTFLGAVLLSMIRKVGVQRMPLSRKIFRLIGVLPIRDHYYEPLFNPKHLRYSLRRDRTLPGIDFNIKEQLELINKFKYSAELAKFPKNKINESGFYYYNGSFGPPDAQYLYNIIRLLKPRKMIEIGSGYSTLMAESAICANKREAKDYNCEHICIEPYSFPWLEKLNIRLMRKRVEEVNIEEFKSLNNSDILFIDSSHIIRPQGDILSEYLEILPVLKSGVFAHIHDIFTPRDYLNSWVIDEIRLWNEQYLLEAFLTFNSDYKIVAALNHLKHHYPSELAKACPILKMEPDEEPCSFWIVRK